MTTLDNHQSSHFVKLLYLGDSGTGKTGSLVSLIEAGYKLKIVDLDNGLDALFQWARHQCPDKMSNVQFVTLRDSVRITSVGPIIKPTAYVAALKAMSEWEDETIPAEDGTDSIFIVDSGTTLGRSALEWAKGQNPGAKDPRQWYFAAQESMENVFGMLTSEAFQTNLIFITHINYKELEEGVHKGWPMVVGSALGPKIPKYFNTVVQAEVSGTGKSAKRTIRTLPTPVIDLKNPAPFQIEERYSLGEGLAQIFETLKTSQASE